MVGWGISFSAKFFINTSRHYGLCTALLEICLKSFIISCHRKQINPFDMILRISRHLFFFYNFVYNVAWFFLNLEDFMEILTLNQVNQYININHLFHISCTWRQSIMSWYTFNNEKFWNVLLFLEFLSLMTLSTWMEKKNEIVSSDTWFHV